jgi:NCS1 family nucleobase:cation symporter-1
MLWTAISVVQVSSLLYHLVIVLSTCLRLKAGGFLENMISAIWPKFPNWNRLPPGANITSSLMVCVIIYWLIQTFVSILPIKLVLSILSNENGKQ